MQEEVINEALDKLGCPTRVQDRLEAFGLGIAGGVKYVFQNFSVTPRQIPPEVPSENVQTEHPGPRQVDGGHRESGTKASSESKSD